MLAIMADCSRNAVMTVKTGKTFIDNMALMGYDTLMLYTEDTYEVPGEPYFGYLRGRFSQDEIRELVAYGEEKGIELIPCIQTLGHLKSLFRWPEYLPINDTADILLTENARTMTLIENMLKSARTCYKTDKIHIGMDEAHMVGLGKYLDQHGFQQRHEIFCRHLTEVCKLCKKYGFAPMMWSDMFFRLSCQGEYYAKIPEDQIDWIKSLIPKDVRLVFWDYYTHTPSYEEDVDFCKMMLEQHRKLSNNEPLFAGGIWTWEGPVPVRDKAMKVTKPVMQACRETGVKDVLITAWGDDGGECSYISALPLYFYAAETYRGNTDLELIKSRYRQLFHMDFDDAASLADLESVQMEDRRIYAVSKLYLHNDILLGVADHYAPPQAEEAYEKLAKKYAALAEKEEMSPLWQLEFQHAAALAELLSVKTCLGAKLRSAYQSGDRAALQKLADNDLPLAIEKAESYFEAVRKLWFAEKKAFGFEVQEMRLSYIVTRLRSTLARLKDYLDGGAGIEELEQTILDTKFHAARWNRLATPNVIFLNF